MKNEIIVCLSNKHGLYEDQFVKNNIKIGNAYKCVDDLTLTSDRYYIPEFASLSGVTIIAGVNRWGWSGICLPRKCFRVATSKEARRFKLYFRLKLPFYLCKIYFFKTLRKVDHIARRKYYKKMAEDFGW